jgi:hypothetical protein
MKLWGYVEMRIRQLLGWAVVSLSLNHCSRFPQVRVCEMPPLVIGASMAVAPNSGELKDERSSSASPPASEVALEPISFMTGFS